MKYGDNITQKAKSTWMPRNLMNQRNNIMKHKKITEMEVEEIRRELQESQRNHLEEREEEELEHSGTIRDGEQKPDAASTTEEEMEIHQQRNQIHKLKEKVEGTYYQVTQIAIDKRPRLQKLQNMFKIKAIIQTANKAMDEILDGKDLYITELNHLIYATAMVTTEEINGTGEYKLETQRSKTPPWVRCIRESINDISKELWWK
jgi:small-conductance mechanosensitive channel